MFQRAEYRTVAKIKHIVGHTQHLSKLSEKKILRSKLLGLERCLAQQLRALVQFSVLTSVGGRGSQLLVSGRSDALFGLYMFTDSTHTLSLTHRHINKYKCLLKVQSYTIMGLSWTPIAKSTKKIS